MLIYPVAGGPAVAIDAWQHFFLLRIQCRRSFRFFNPNPALQDWRPGATVHDLSVFDTVPGFGFTFGPEQAAPSWIWASTQDGKNLNTYTVAIAAGDLRYLGIANWASGLGAIIKNAEDRADIIWRKV